MDHFNDNFMVLSLPFLCLNPPVQSQFTVMVWGKSCWYIP